jgi:hypothetical protein
MVAGGAGRVIALGLVHHLGTAAGVPAAEAVDWLPELGGALLVESRPERT